LSTQPHFARALALPGGTVELQTCSVFYRGVEKRQLAERGVSMSYTKTLFLFVLLAAVSMTACSGLGDDGHGGVTPPSGNATLSVTLQALPLTPPPNTTILSYSVTLAGVSLTPASGSSINTKGTATFDLTRLQSDSAFLATFSAPAGNYTSMTLSFVDAAVTYCSVTAGVPGCNTATIPASVSAAAAAPIITFPNGGLVLTSGQQTGLSVLFDMGGTLTVANQVVTGVAVTNTTLSTITLGTSNPSSLASTQLDYLEDVNGVVTVSGNQVTIATATHGTLVTTANSSTYYTPNCNLPGVGDGSNTINCVQNNQIASINAILNQDGTMTLITYDPFPPPQVTNNSDWIEGVVAINPTSSTVFTIVASDVDFSNANSLLPSPAASFPIGSPITATLSVGALFAVDTQGLTVPADLGNFPNASDTSVLLPGQMVAVHVTKYTTAGTAISVNTDAVYLRFTRIPGSAATQGSNTVFTLSSSSLPAFYNFTTATQLVQLTGTPPSTSTSNATNYDGITASTSITVGDTYSSRALYFGQFDAMPFVAAKVRQNQ
jgi:hypothetical protein